MTTEPVWAGIAEKRPCLRLDEKCFFWPKMRFIPKKYPKLLQRLIFILEKGTFFLTTFSGRGQNMIRVKKCFFFLGSKSRFLAQKNDFCHTTPILDNGPFVALREMLHFPPWGRFFDFLFPSYGRLCKKKNGQRVIKS